MNKYLSLTRREFRVSRKRTIIKLSMMLVMFLFCIISAFVTKKNIEKDEVLALFSQMLSLGFLISGITVMEDDDGFISDLTSGWLRYSYVLPIRPFERTAAHFIKKLVMAAVMFVFHLLTSCLLNLIFGTSFSLSYIVLFVLMMCTMVLSQIFHAAFSMRCRDLQRFMKMKNRSTIINLIVILVGVIAAIWLSGFDLKDFILKNVSAENIDIFGFFDAGKLLWAISLLIVLSAVHFVVYYNSLKRYDTEHSAASKASVSNTKSAGESLSANSDHILKGFFSKEVRQNKKTIIGMMTVPVYTLGLVALFLCFISYMLGKNIMVSEMKTFPWIVNCLSSGIGRSIVYLFALFMVSTYITSIFHGDTRRLWAYFVIAAPGGIKHYMRTKYVLAIVSCGLSIAVILLINLILCTMNSAVNDVRPPFMMKMILLMFFGLVLVSSWSIPLSVRFGSKKASYISAIILTVIGIILVAVLGFMCSNYEIDDVIGSIVEFFKDKSMSRILNVIGVVFSVISVGAFILSFRFSCTSYLKGVENYDD